MESVCASKTSVSAGGAESGSDGDQPVDIRSSLRVGAECCDESGDGFAVVSEELTELYGAAGLGRRRRETAIGHQSAQYLELLD